MSVVAPEIPVGTFQVVASAGEATAFRAATGLFPPDDQRVLPLTFPMRWMVEPEVRAALIKIVADPDLILVHEGQTLDYLVPLEVGETYGLALAATRQHAPERLVVRGKISSSDGTIRATLETVLRLFGLPAAA